MRVVRFPPLASKQDLVSKFSALAPNIINYPDETITGVTKMGAQGGDLGAPIFDGAFRDFITEKNSKFQLAFDRLLNLNSHMILTFVRICPFVPKFT